jgi:hypothetical protein
VIVDEPAAFRAAAQRLPAEPWGPATARGALLVAPDGFRLDDEARNDNRYMAPAGRVSEARAQAEHAVLAGALGSILPVSVVPGSPETPDALFPNNVFATVPGRAIVGRMRHAGRRLEAGRADLREWLTSSQGYELIDLSHRDDLVAELTGPLVIDRLRGIGYYGLSERCNRAGAEAMHAVFGLRLTYVFDLAAGEYHTNVVLSVLAGRALVIHTGSLADPDAAEAIAEVYPDRALRLSDAEKADFVGNCLAPVPGEVWMSGRAEAALESGSRAALERWGFRIRSFALDEIEKAGGSLRCCIAELF